MADVFISYTKPEREYAKVLDAALRKAGLSVWWDIELIPVDRFRSEIDKQLNECTAAVVIWSTESAKSNWVLSEADHALRQGKLVNAHHSDIRPEQLPKPFGQIHAVSVADTASIIKAIRHLQAAAAMHVVLSSNEANAIKFITDAIDDALRYAPALQALAEKQQWKEIDSYSAKLLKAAEAVHAPLRLFRERLPYAGITSYKGRRFVEQLEEATTYAHRQIGKEIGWLQSYRNRESVVIGARGDLAAAAAHLLEEVTMGLDIVKEKSSPS